MFKSLLYQTHTHITHKGLTETKFLKLNIWKGKVSEGEISLCFKDMNIGNCFSGMKFLFFFSLMKGGTSRGTKDTG